MSIDEQFMNITITPVDADPDSKTSADVIVVLDESGSMQSMGKEPEQSVNTFIEEQKKLDGDARISLYKFNSNVTTVYKNQKLSETGKFTDYKPSDMTALWDAVGKAITDKLNTENNRNVVMMVITDGEDNSSREFSRTKIRELITRVEKEYEWKVQMLGANIDTAVEGGSVGIARAHCAAYAQCEKGDLSDLVRATSDACTYYRKCAMRNEKAVMQDLSVLKSAVKAKRQSM